MINPNYPHWQYTSVHIINSELTKTEYFLCSEQWHNAFPPPPELHLESLLRILQEIIDSHKTERAQIQEPDEFDQNEFPELSISPKQSDGTWAFVSGPWDLFLCPEPFITSQIRISPGATFQTLEMKIVDNKKWTRILLEDGCERWLEGETSPDLKLEGRIATFSRVDRRTFFIVHHETPFRIGFLLANVAVNNNKGSAGEQNILSFMDVQWGNISIPILSIRRIEINRKQKNGRAVKIYTSNKIYLGDFPPPETNLYRSVYLVVTKPFVNLSVIGNCLQFNKMVYLNRRWNYE